MTLRLLSKLILTGVVSAGIVYTVSSQPPEPLPLPGSPTPPAKSEPANDPLPLPGAPAALPPAGEPVPLPPPGPSMPVVPASGVAPLPPAGIPPVVLPAPGVPSVPPPVVTPPVIPAPAPKVETAPTPPVIPAPAPKVEAAPAPRPMLAPMPSVASELPPMVFPKVESKPTTKDEVKPTPIVKPELKATPVSLSPAPGVKDEPKPPVVVGVIGTSKEPPPASVIPSPKTAPVATVSRPAPEAETPPPPMAPAVKPIVETPPMTATVEMPKTPPVTTASGTAETKAFSEVKISKAPVEGLAAYTVMLAESKLMYSKVMDYTGVVLHQDRLRGKLATELQAEIAVKTKPASISLRYADPGAIKGLELVHVKDRNNGKVRMKPAGTPSTTRLITVNLSDPQATSHSRHLVTEFGIGPMIEMLEKQLVVEQRVRNTLQVSVADYTYNGRLVTRYEMHNERPHALRMAYRTVVYVDKETKLPIRYEAYDQPSIGASQGELLESYSYINLKFNQGIGDERFEK